MSMIFCRRLLSLLVTLILVVGSVSPSSITAIAASATGKTTSTPIKHLVVIFQENVSFDHYFGTYPNAKNPPGESKFSPLSNTPSINGLTIGLLTNNTNLANPWRLDKSQVVTVASCDPDHSYAALQKEMNGGLMDKFVQNSALSIQHCDPKLVMGYFDGNTVTSLWNYAQHFAMSDNFHSSNIDPSLPGAINLVTGQTHGATPRNISKIVANGTSIGDIDSIYDDCSAAQHKTISMTGSNIGNLMNEKGITWGWFEGGFKPSSISNNTKAVCGTSHQNIVGKNITDYVVHHEPFQYYQSTANQHHLPPTSVAMIGHSDQANHQYGLNDFWAAAQANNLPAVSYLKAPHYQDGHPGVSDPIDEQRFLVNTVNRLQQLPEWNSTAVIIAYDDSGGWYDHAMPPIISQSNDPINDALLGHEYLCGHAPVSAYQDRCGYGVRLPLLVISPYAKVNYVDHSITDQTSILRFIEDNWHLGRIGNQSFDSKAGTLLNMFNFTTSHNANKLFLDPSTGQEK
ncbi:MAG: alkaline phosphatase family protein [Candidatus Nitrosopolaris sp.]